jgi:acetyl esterase
MGSLLNPASLRKKVGSKLIEGFFRGLSGAAKLHPRARLDRHGVEVIKDQPYQRTGRPEHLLDIYRSTVHPPPWPVVLYVHGGGFRILSKDTHWLMGLIFARRGYLVFNINYRLAPQHPYPAALQDAAEAYAWVVRHAAEYGGDPRRLVVAGESAGANLTTALTVAACFERPEPYARQVFDTGRTPDVILPMCGMFQVSDPERFGRQKKMAQFISDRLVEVSRAYLPDPGGLGAALDLADPITVLESDVAPTRPLPPCFTTVGTKDPLLPDTRRLATAWRRRGVACEERYYPGEVHAFQAFVWRKLARECWAEQFGFLNDQWEG